MKVETLESLDFSNESLLDLEMGVVAQATVVLLTSLIGAATGFDTNATCWVNATSLHSSDGDAQRVLSVLPQTPMKKTKTDLGKLRNQEEASTD